MEHEIYELTASLERITHILEGNGEEYKRYPYIPEDEMLKEQRGNFIECVVVISRFYFNEINISLLNLAKVYDIYLKEAYAILSEHYLCREIFFHGNNIVALYNIGGDGFMNELMDVAGRISSLPDVINVKIGRKEKPLVGNVLVMDRGYQFASEISGGIKYFGGMLSKAEDWIRKPGEGERELRGVYASSRAYEWLKVEYKVFFKETGIDGVLHGYIENIGMARWVKEQK